MAFELAERAALQRAQIERVAPQPRAHDGERVTPIGRAGRAGLRPLVTPGRPSRQTNAASA
jgi:hypothetical protein